MTQRINWIRVAQVFQGWTLEYIRELDPFDMSDILGVLDGDALLRKH